ncbi:Hypothetical predicted protein [Xyrichtys novacula]|uniref:Uncharacterized protein n=1 Tax=Xyrichtys novacula TaxID=13765 RepID=A0AAV1FXT9_XYRNO|nr:Hypothetical predicted protein [Xyrichtys novacula]
MPKSDPSQEVEASRARGPGVHHRPLRRVAQERGEDLNTLVLVTSTSMQEEGNMMWRHLPLTAHKKQGREAGDNNEGEGQTGASTAVRRSGRHCHHG